MLSIGQKVHIPFKGSYLKSERVHGGHLWGCELSSSLESLHGGARRAPHTQNSLQEQRDLQLRHQASVWMQSNVFHIYDASLSPETRICWQLSCNKKVPQEIPSSREMPRGLGIARKKALNAFKNAANHSELWRNDLERRDYVTKVWMEIYPAYGRISIQALG